MPIQSNKPSSRGTGLNPSGRFSTREDSVFDDGWGFEEVAPIRTELRTEKARRIITRNTSPDLSFDRSVNPYRGCEHGCIYCFARPTHAYLDLSPGLDFETKLTVKPNAPDRLARELSAKGYTPAPMAFGTNTDPYQPVELKQNVMRQCLDVLRDFQHPVMITTKGALIERDLDILSDLAANSLVSVGISVTTLDARLCRQMEPRAPSPERRLKAIERLADAGVPVRVLASPMIPGLTDHELEAILTAARDAGASASSWVLLRQPFEVAELFRDWLQACVPDQANKVMARIRESHGGMDYDSKWFKRMRGEGLYAKMISQRYKVAVRRLGLSESGPNLRTDLFHVPPRAGDQLSLF
ncbi:PA0069 family radical SAM protein [Shimia ponticola]|uniref:PA0069 family radical SAM protein n=1 Tax=Shimia ponticola TaxID=2582893 RepID=UPI0011BF85EC|nr:PA0069 family radical SAM protein [Shimia ponticola]